MMSSSAGVVKTLGHKFLMRLLFPKYVAKYVSREKSSLWNPDYLEEARSKFPEYAVTNIQLKGFDYVILENYQKKIHWICKHLDLYVTDAWAQECKKVRVVRFKTKSEIPECEHILKLYERNVQVSDVNNFQMGTLIDLVISICPPGVTVRFHPHEKSYYEDRFVPELKLFELKQELNDLNSK